MIKCIQDLGEWQNLRATFPSTHQIGFVPTMGNLHPGHLSLCHQSRRDNDLTVVSLFINPTQFNQEADFLHYPKTLEADLNLLQEAAVDYCLLPPAAQLYKDHYHYRVEEHAYAQALEGRCRPGHYTGVLTIVMKLFHLVKPHHAYFGEKDFQQFQLIQGMVDAFFMDIQVHVCPTIREPSGLAYSSRNTRLTPEEKIQATIFARLFHQPDLSIEAIREALVHAQIEVEYLEVHQNRRFAAVHIGQVRLIDNYSLAHP